MEIYQVGGCVRDLLLRQAGFSTTTSDRDWVVVGATPEMMTKQGFIPVGKNFPVFLHPETHEEYALARTERKVAKGYHGFTFYAEPDVTLEEDLARRDLTINAIAMAENGTLIDPYHGQEDIQRQCLRHVSTAFCEDPVRILRLARFSARFPTFHVASETLHLCQRMVDNGEADALVAERVWKEMSRGFAEVCPRAMLQVLADCGYWARALPTIALTEAGLSAIDRAAASHWDAQTRTAVIATIIFATDPESARRLKVPSHIEQLIDLTHRKRNALLTAIRTNTAENWAHVFETCDVLRRRERFELFLKVCAILDDIDPDITTQLVDAFCSVQPKTLKLQGLSAQEIRQTILEARTAQIRAVLKA